MSQLITLARESEQTGQRNRHCALHTVLLKLHARTWGGDGAYDTGTITLLLNRL
jgi:hypothetical protein